MESKDIQKAFQELIEDDYQKIAQRILKSIRKKRKDKDNDCLFGYDIVEGVPTINREKSKIVKWIYERYLYYLENPPIDLIQIVLKRAKECGEIKEDISYEEAKYLVNDELIKKYIAEELSLKVIYHKILSEKISTVRIEDILSLHIEDIPKEELENLMTDISKKENYKCIKRVLKEEFYSGINKCRKSNHLQKGARSYKEQYIVVENHHEPIISPEMWAAAQEANKNNKK